MVELADIFRGHGAEYRAKFADRMLPSHLEAMRAIQECRTEALGGHVYFCEACQEMEYSYHSCKNRHCPKCGGVLILIKRLSPNKLSLRNRAPPS